MPCGWSFPEPERAAVKSQVKALLRTVRPSRRPPIVVASMGRSGSTLVYDALRSAVGDERFGWLGHDRARATVTAMAFGPATTRFENGVVYKTHALPAEFDDVAGSALAEARFVFVFGPPSDAVISFLTLGERYSARWVRAHLHNLRATDDASEILDRDVLGLQRQLECWARVTHREVLCLEYDALWDEQSTLSDFLDLEIELPPRRDRLSTDLVAADQVALARRRYARGDAAVAALPGAFRAGTVSITSSDAWISEV